MPTACLAKISTRCSLPGMSSPSTSRSMTELAFGITLISRNPTHWLSYIDLGRKLQQLQMNDIHLGFMSSGYSSKTGNDLPSAAGSPAS